MTMLRHSVDMTRSASMKGTNQHPRTEPLASAEDTGLAGEREVVCGTWAGLGIGHKVES